MGGSGRCPFAAATAAQVQWGECSQPSAAHNITRIEESFRPRDESERRAPVTKVISRRLVRFVLLNGGENRQFAERGERPTTENERADCAGGRAVRASPSESCRALWDEFDFGMQCETTSAASCGARRTGQEHWYSKRDWDAPG